MKHSEVVGRPVVQSRMLSLPGETTPTSNSYKLYVDYKGHRTSALFDRMTKRIDIVDGPLAGTLNKSPSSAAQRFGDSLQAKRQPAPQWLVILVD